MWLFVISKLSLLEVISLMEPSLSHAAAVTEPGLYDPKPVAKRGHHRVKGFMSDMSRGRELQFCKGLFGS